MAKAKAGRKSGFEVMMDDIRTIPGAVWTEKERNDFMTCQGFAPSRDFGSLTLEEILGNEELRKFIMF